MKSDAMPYFIKTRLKVGKIPDKYFKLIKLMPHKNAVVSNSKCATFRDIFPPILFYLADVSGLF